MTLSCHSLGFALAVLFNLNTTISGSKDRGQFPSLIRLKELYHALATSPVLCFTLSGVRFPTPFPLVLILANATVTLDAGYQKPNLLTD